MISICGSFFLPETPKFYFSHRRWEDARRSLTVIGRFNNKGAFNGTFDEEQRLAEKAIKQLNASKIDSNYDKTTTATFLEQDILRPTVLEIKEEREMTGTLKDLVKVRR